MKTQILDIVKRLVKWDKKLEIYTNGEDNAYPERVDRLVNNSVTAKMSLSILVQYLLGKGFGDKDNLIINQNNKQKLIYFAEDVADSLAEFRGVAIHFDYNALFEPVNPVVLPFETIRIGKKDSKKYNGKILTCDDWTEAKAENISTYDVFNSNTKVVEAQIKAQDGIDKYKGQILYINYDKNYYYPLSRIDSVMNDCDSEAQASIYKNQLLRNGFFGKTLIITKPLVDQNIDEFIYDSEGNKTPNREYTDLESEATEVKKTIEEFIGSENAGGAMLMEMDWAGDKMDDAIKFVNIDGKIDDKMFEYTENSVSKNILMAFENIPVALVKSPDTALLGNSGEAIKEAKKTYWQNTNKERNRFETLLNEVLFYVGLQTETDYLMVMPLIEGVKTLSVADEVESSPEASEETLKAQASLRGSVGGVQGILGIQQSVSQGLTDIESAITILMEIYGFSRAVSAALLGKPDIENGNNN